MNEKDRFAPLCRVFYDIAYDAFVLVREDDGRRFVLEKEGLDALRPFVSILVPVDA